MSKVEDKMRPADDESLDITTRKKAWPPGPWTDEPDRVEFQHAGLPCLLVRGSVGSWCGYAAVAPGHPLHGKDYDDAPVDVHGGLTYASECQGKVCHKPPLGEPDNVWWFGFDTAHCGDLSPAMEALRARPDWPRLGGRLAEVYRDVDYVLAETRRLAEQLAELAQ